MNADHWTEKAERLRDQLQRVRHVEPGEPQHEQQIERDTIADWLRREFSEEPPQDTATLPLFDQA